MCRLLMHLGDIEGSIECQCEFGYVLGIACLNRVTPKIILKLLIC